MDKYHKIQTVYLRDPDNQYKTLLMGQFALPEFEYLANNRWVFTEKIDGMNIRVDWDCERVKIGGRTDRAQVPTFLLVRLQELFHLDEFKQLYPQTPMTLYGEGYGARIQKGGNYIPDDVSFVLFDIKIGGNWLRRWDVSDIAKHLGINVVPAYGYGTLEDAVEMTRKGFWSQIGTQLAEGLVMRPDVELVSRTGHRIICKIKHKDFVK